MVINSFPQLQWTQSAVEPKRLAIFPEFRVPRTSIDFGMSFPSLGRFEFFEILRYQYLYIRTPRGLRSRLCAPSNVIYPFVTLKGILLCYLINSRSRHVPYLSGIALKWAHWFGRNVTHALFLKLRTLNSLWSHSSLCLQHHPQRQFSARSLSETLNTCIKIE